jgi:hypothetical protein
MTSAWSAGLAPCAISSFSSAMRADTSCMNSTSPSGISTTPKSLPSSAR